MHLSVSEVADLLSVSGKTVYRWVKLGRLPAYRLGHQLRFNRSELLEWAAANRVTVSPQSFSTKDDGPPTTVGKALRTGGIRYRVGGETKQDALRAAVDTLHLPDHIDRAFLLDVLLARESLGSTGVGEGVAIPHVRNPVTLQITHPSITLCFLEHAVDFDAVDGKPVDKLVVITSPTVRVHLTLLSRLAYLLLDPKVKQTLRDIPGRHEIFRVVEAREATLCGELEVPEE